MKILIWSVEICCRTQAISPDLRMQLAVNCWWADARKLAPFAIVPV